MGRPIDKSKIRRILIRATNWVGDAVMTMPALEAVNANFPDAQITVLARPWVIPLLENHPAVIQQLFPIGAHSVQVEHIGAQFASNQIGVAVIVPKGTGILPELNILHMVQIPVTGRILGASHK